MSKSKILFALAMAVSLPIALEAVHSASAAQLTPPPPPPVPTESPLDPSFPLRIEAGSNQDYTDAQGQLWRADAGFVGGQVVDRGAVEIAGTDNDRLYQTERWGLDGYIIKVPNGKYTVRLHFAETSFDVAGKRLFTVAVEDQKITDIDIFAETGGSHKAVVKTFDDVVVDDGELDITFTGVGGFVNAIEVVEVHEAHPTVLRLSHLVAENSPAGTVIGVVAPVDAAAGDVLTYSLADSAGDRFLIDAESGRITVAPDAELDFESATTHSITVSAVDARGNVATQDFAIDLGDINEAPTAILLNGNSIAEDAAAGTVVGTALAADPDAADRLTYTLVDDAEGLFTIDPASGSITVAPEATFSYAASPRHRITVRASDSAGLSIDQTFWISVKEKRDLPQSIFIQSGSDADFLDNEGRTWSADHGFVGGNLAERGAIEIGGTEDDRIYQTERWGMTGYSVDVPMGSYNVKLHFAETSPAVDTSGKRIFSADIEGHLVNDIDVFAEAGGPRKALVKAVSNVVVTDGKLDISFEAKAGAPMINGIEIEPVLICQAPAN